MKEKRRPNNQSSFQSTQSINDLNQSIISIIDWIQRQTAQEKKMHVPVRERKKIISITSRSSIG